MRFRALVRKQNFRLKNRQLILMAVSLLGLLRCAGIVSAQETQNPCGPITASYGPFDFRRDRDKLPIVTGSHFTAEVEALVRGTTSRLPGGDIAYTLRAIPNHPGALLAMVRLSEKEKLEKPQGSTYSIDCWFERAIRFRADDQVVRMIYASFLNSKQRKPEAMQQLEFVKSIAGDNPFTHYNLGMLYADLNEYDAALVQAHRAAALGFTQPALREKLQSAGQWRSPLEAPSVPEVEPQASQSVK